MKEYKYRTLGVGVSFGKTRAYKTCPICNEVVKGGISIHTLISSTGSYERVWFHDKCFIRHLLDKKPFCPFIANDTNYFERWSWGRCIMCNDYKTLPKYKVGNRGIHDKCLSALFSDEKIQEVIKELNLSPTENNEILSRLI